MRPGSPGGGHLPPDAGGVRQQLDPGGQRAGGAGDHGEILDGALRCKWCKETIDPSDPPPLGAARRTAHDASIDLTNAACAIGGGIAFIPIPGTTVALTGLELLLMGAIACVWGSPLTGSLVATVATAMAVRLGLTTALQVVSEVLSWLPVVGLVAKPAVAAVTIKLVGTGVNDIFATFYGWQHPAAITADEGKKKLEEAYARIKELAPELKEGLLEAFKGNGDRLADTLNKIFGLGKHRPEEGHK